MKKTEGQITLDGKTYKAVQRDYNSYKTETGTVTVGGTVYSAKQKIGEEAATYTITVNATNVTADSGNPTTILEGTTATLLFTANAGYTLPTTMSIAGATGTWDKATGTLVLSNATEDVSVTVVGEPCAPAVYYFDTTVSDTFMTNTGEWASFAGTYYYSIIPLTSGKLYKLTLTDKGSAIRWRNSQASTNVIGSASLSWVGGNESPVSGDEIVFTASSPYLISYSGSAQGGSLTLTEYPISDDCLCFTAQQANSSVYLSKVGTPYENTIQYSFDGNTWQNENFATPKTLANVGDKIYYKGNGDLSKGNSSYYRFVMTGLIGASGNVMTLLDQAGESTTISKDCTFFHLFYMCSSLTSSPKLPATTLTSDCYSNMFYNCTSLETVPALPATQLQQRCYQNMFRGCTSLKVYSSSGEGHDKLWRIPTEGDATSYTTQNYMFYGTDGTYRTSTQIAVNRVYYTQNAPV